MDLGSYVAQIRMEKGWSQHELARRTHGVLTYGSIQQIESGTTGNPKLASLLAIAKALEIHPMNLIFAFQGKDPEVLPEFVKNDVLVGTLEDILKQLKSNE